MYKLIYSKFVSVLFPKNLSRISPIIYLMFHSIDDGLHKDSIYNIPVARFMEICEFLFELKVTAEK